MDRENTDDNIVRERRTFLRAGTLGALAFLLDGSRGSESEAADVRYNKADLAKVNQKLKTSVAEREAFYKDPQGYLKIHNIQVSQDMIPGREEVENALNSNPGKVAQALAAVDGMNHPNSRAMTSVVILSVAGNTTAPAKAVPLKTMQ